MRTWVVILMLLAMASLSKACPCLMPNKVVNLPFEVLYGRDNYRYIWLNAGSYTLLYDVESTIAQPTSATVTIKDTANDSIIAQTNDSQKLVFSLPHPTRINIHFHINQLVVNTLILNIHLTKNK
jgi:hypothetical protein